MCNLCNGKNALRLITKQCKRRIGVFTYLPVTDDGLSAKTSLKMKCFFGIIESFVHSDYSPFDSLIPIPQNAQLT